MHWRGQGKGHHITTEAPATHRWWCHASLSATAQAQQVRAKVAARRVQDSDSCPAARSPGCSPALRDEDCSGLWALPAGGRRQSSVHIACIPDISLSRAPERSPCPQPQQWKLGRGSSPAARPARSRGE